MSETVSMEAEVAATAGSPLKKVPVSEANPKSNGDSGEKATNGNGDTSSPSKSNSDDLKKAMQKLAAGRRDLLVLDPNSAVASLAEACELLGKIYGETAKECGEAYFYYGKALLELARMEAGVINNVLDGVPDTEDEEDSSFVEGPKPTEEELADVSEKVGKALEENFEELEKVKKERDAKKEGEKPATNGKENGANGHQNGVNGHQNGDKSEDKDKPKNESEENSEEDEEEANEEEKEGEEASKEETAEGEAGPSAEEDEEEPDDGKENESIGSNDAGTSAAKDSTDQNAIDKEDEDDPSNLQLAWEMLELAKTIFSKHADSLEATSPVRLELESKLSETYQTLGEVSIENENYAQAIEDLTMCLRRRQELLPEDSRCIAETHYQLGVAMGFNAQFDEAVNALSDAINVLEKRTQLLKEGKHSPNEAKAKDAFYTPDREIKEIEGIIPEIREKIADTKDMQEETIKKIGDRRLMEDVIATAATASNNGNGAIAAASSSSTTAADEAASSSKKSAAGNISHLVKKRKKSDDATETNGDVKKPHLENGVSSEANGEASSSKA